MDRSWRRHRAEKVPAYQRLSPYGRSRSRVRSKQKSLDSPLPKSIHRCRRYPTKFNSGRDIPKDLLARPRPVTVGGSCILSIGAFPSSGSLKPVSCFHYLEGYAAFLSYAIHNFWLYLAR